MKKVIFAIVLAFSFLFSLTTVFAYPSCGSYQAPDQSSAFCRYDLIANTTYRVQPGIPFVWLRSDPSSGAPPIGTVFPSSSVSLATVGGAGHWDGYQWWWEMTTYPGQGVRGWVEQASLSYISADASPATPAIEGISDPSIQIQANWTTPFGAVMEQSPKVSFVWMREAPGAGKIVYTLRPADFFQVTGSPAFDGYQWWWPATISKANETISGWVEQGSITPLN